jgi:hypothetical protein
VIAGHRPSRRMHHRAGTIVDARDLGPFMDHRPRRLRRLRQTDGVVQGVDMTRAPDPTLRPQRHLTRSARGYRRGPRLRFGYSHSPAPVCRHISAPCPLRRWNNRHGRCRVKPYRHGVIGDQRPHHPLRLFGQIPEMARIVTAPPFSLQRVLILPLARAHLTAIAPRGTKAHPLRLKHHHRQSRCARCSAAERPV